METTMNPNSSTFKGAVICATVFLASAAPSWAADVDYSRYFKSSTALSAVSSAISILEPCEKPISFSEKVDDDIVTFSASCESSDGEAITVNLTFQRDESGDLFPDSFDYAN
jgi:hypothetical protein